MTAISKAIQNVRPGNVQSFANLQITPLLATVPGNAQYLTLDEAQARGLAAITEVSEAGRVATVLLENNSEQAVFLLDGEELAGAKQNRILNISLLSPPQTKLQVPVSCVERGRWTRHSDQFACSERVFFSKGRARKAERVSENLRENGHRVTDQGEVWEDIDIMMRSMSVNSSTGAIGDAFAHFSDSVDQYVQAFSASDTQVGACFAINGKICGVELFDSSATWHQLMPKIIRSYALDAIEIRQDSAAITTANVSEFLQAVAVAPVDSFAALGEGEDVRFTEDSLAGGALVVGEQVVHLCVFDSGASLAAV